MARHPESSTTDVCLYFLAIFLPPLAVFLKRGFHADFWINILLTIFAWLPGVIHAWYVITKFERPALKERMAAPPVTTAPMTTAPVTTAPAGTAPVGAASVRPTAY